MAKKKRNQNVNIPFVKQYDGNGNVSNFPGRVYVHYLPNRRARRFELSNKIKMIGLNYIQKIFKFDRIHFKFKVIKTIYHYL
jgi:hypothetical protein